MTMNTKKVVYLFGQKIYIQLNSGEVRVNWAQQGLVKCIFENLLIRFSYLFK